MFFLIRRFALGIALAVAWSGALAAVVFSDDTFNLAGYSITGPYASDPRIALAAGQCGACGSPGAALDVTFTLTGSASGFAALGLVNNGFTYDPGTQGAIASIDAFVDKNLIISAEDTGGFTGPAGNTFRPLIRQGGVFYLATIAGPLLPTAPGSTGYNAISRAGLLAIDFVRFDFSTGLFGVGNPDFAAGVMSFGLGQISSTGAFVFTNATFEAQYDNLRFEIRSVPEPSILLLLAGAILALGLGRRKA